MFTSRSFKKGLLATLSSLLIAGSFTPTLVNAEGSEELIEEDEPTEAQRLNAEYTEDAEAQYQEYSAQINEQFTTFLTNYDSFSEEEKMNFVVEFGLFVDDEGTLHTSIEPLDLTQYEVQDHSLVEFVQGLDQEDLKQVDAYQEFQEFNLSDLEGNSLETTDSSLEQNVLSSSVEQHTVNRIEGENRYHTAARISQQRWNSSSTMVIASGQDFADALTASSLAGALRSPILLAGPSGRNHHAIEEARRLGVRIAFVVGGDSAINQDMINRLEAEGIEIRRFAGENRYETSELVAREVINRTGADEAFLVSGQNFADAISIAPYAARDGVPILLTRTRTLEQSVQNISSIINNWTIIGGAQAVDGTRVGKPLANMGNNVSRIQGVNRYQTNVRVTNEYGFSGNQAYVATGEDFADALTGSVLAGVNNTGVLLAHPNQTERERLLNHTENHNLGRYTIFGGASAVSNDIAEVLQYRRVNGRRPLVVLDPGHGGRFSGASYNGVHEKTLALETSLLIRDRLESSGDYEVLMTRDTDRHFSTDLTQDLNYRGDLANENNADIFISVHYNAMPGGTARGIETFVHHTTYPSQASRSQLNTSIPRIAESARLADAIQPRLISRTGLRDRGVRGLNLNVLRRTEMPAVLLELGYMNNPTEFNIVRQWNHWNNSSLAVHEGLDNYFGF